MDTLQTRALNVIEQIVDTAHRMMKLERDITFAQAHPDRHNVTEVQEQLNLYRNYSMQLFGHVRPDRDRSAEELLGSDP